MADEAQVIYEYTNGNTVEFKTNDLTITWKRRGLEVNSRPDGNIYVDDPDVPQRTFTFTAVSSGADVNEMNTVQTGTIAYDATYPRIQKIYLSGVVTLTNIPVAVTAFSATDLGSGHWEVSITMEEYTSA